VAIGCEPSKKRAIWECLNRIRTEYGIWREFTKVLLHGHRWKICFRRCCAPIAAFYRPIIEDLDAL